MIQIPSLVPTFVLQKGDKVEDIPHQTCYLIASDGFYIKQKQKLFDALTKVTSLSTLADVKEYINPEIPRIPLGVILAVESFFEKVYDKYKSEAVVILHRNPENAQWLIDVPEQQVSSASAKYDRKTKRNIEGYVRIGTIHSHASMGAFHSGVDDADEENFDGVHITIGNLDKTEKTYSFRLMIVGKSFKIEPMNILSTAEFDFPEVPQEWMDKVSEYKYVTQFYGEEYDYYGEGYFRHYNGAYYDKEGRYRGPNALPEETGKGRIHEQTMPNGLMVSEAALQELELCGHKSRKGKIKNKLKKSSFIERMRGAVRNAGKKSNEMPLLVRGRDGEIL